MSTPSVTDAARRIVAGDGTWTASDAVLCAEFVLAAQEEFYANVEEARRALAEGDEAIVAYLTGKGGRE